MPYLKLENFSGISPRTGPALLAPNQAQVAKNLKLQSGELRPWRKSVLAYQPGNDDVRTIYKLDNVGTGASVWLEWEVDVDVVVSPVADTVDYRVYYTDGIKPKKTNWNLATTTGTGLKPYPNAYLNMGVPAPTVAPTLTIAQPLTGVDVLTGGEGYSSAPSVAFSTGSASATATISGELKSITITNGGSGYTVAPSVVIAGGGGVGATATATVTSGAVTGITINTKGARFTAAPSISFVGGGGASAAATAVISGVVDSVTITSSGSYASAPDVTFSGGGATVQGTAAASFAPIETRSYVYTYVSTFGSVLEESAPSPASVVTCSSSGAAITVSSFGTAPTTAAGYNITAIRVYRSVTSASSASYLYVGEVTVTPATGAASGSLVDTVTAANLGIALPSTTYSPPPDGLKGIISMPNGIMAGFVGNQVWFSEPYLPHAWPVAYMMTVGAQIVGLGVFGQTLVVCTTQTPYLIVGSQPGAMTQEKLPLPEPCVAKKSITSDQFGVLYASPNGLVSIAPGTQDVISRALFTRDEWQSYTPTSMVGVVYQNMYLSFYQAGATRSALVIMRGDTPPLVNLDVAGQAVFVEKATANVFFVSPTDGNIYQLDADPVNNTFYEWTSKLFILPEPTNFGASKFQADLKYITDSVAYNQLVAVISAANQAIWASGAPLKSILGSVSIGQILLGGSILAPIPAIADTRSVQAFLYANGQLVTSIGFTGPEPIRLPAASKEYEWVIQITGNAPMRALKLATSIAELRQI